MNFVNDNCYMTKGLSKTNSMKLLCTIVTSINLINEVAEVYDEHKRTC